MEDNSTLQVQIQSMEQLIFYESERYQNASQKKENLQTRLEILERIRILQKQLEELKAGLKG